MRILRSDDFATHGEDDSPAALGAVGGADPPGFTGAGGLVAVGEAEIPYHHAALLRQHVFHWKGNILCLNENQVNVSQTIQFSQHF